MTSAPALAVINQSYEKPLSNSLLTAVVYKFISQKPEKNVDKLLL